MAYTDRFPCTARAAVSIIIVLCTISLPSITITGPAPATGPDVTVAGGFEWDVEPPGTA